MQAAAIPSAAKVKLQEGLAAAVGLPRLAATERLMAEAEAIRRARERHATESLGDLPGVQQVEEEEKEEVAGADARVDEGEGEAGGLSDLSEQLTDFNTRINAWLELARKEVRAQQHQRQTNRQLSQTDSHCLSICEFADRQTAQTGGAQRAVAAVSLLDLSASRHDVSLTIGSQGDEIEVLRRSVAEQQAGEEAAARQIQSAQRARAGRREADTLRAGAQQPQQQQQLHQQPPHPTGGGGDGGWGAYSELLTGEESDATGPPMLAFPNPAAAAAVATAAGGEEEEEEAEPPPARRHGPEPVPVTAPFAEKHGRPARPASAAPRRSGQTEQVAANPGFSPARRPRPVSAPARRKDLHRPAARTDVVPPPPLHPGGPSSVSRTQGSATLWSAV